MRDLAPADRLAADLRDLVSSDHSVEPNQDRLVGEQAPTIDQLQGEWKARRPEGKIGLDIKGEEFAWDYDLADNDAEFKGKYVLAQDVMVLAAANGSQMVGRVSMNNKDEFTFHLIGADEDDPGIVFERG